MCSVDWCKMFCLLVWSIQISYKSINKLFWDKFTNIVFQNNRNISVFSSLPIAKIIEVSMHLWKIYRLYSQQWHKNTSKFCMKKTFWSFRNFRTAARNRKMDGCMNQIMKNFWCKSSQTVVSWIDILPKGYTE